MWPMTTGYVHVRAETEQWATCHLPQNDREIDKGKGTRCLMRVYGSSYWLFIFTTTWIPSIVLPCMRQETLGHIFAGNIIKCNFVDATIQKKYFMKPFVQVMDLSINIILFIDVALVNSGRYAVDEIQNVHICVLSWIHISCIFGMTGRKKLLIPALCIIKHANNISAILFSIYSHILQDCSTVSMAILWLPRP